MWQAVMSAWGGWRPHLFDVEELGLDLPAWDQPQSEDADLPPGDVLRQLVIRQGRELGQLASRQ